MHVSLTALSLSRRNPWGTSKGPDQKVPVLAAATLNLADFASLSGEKEDGIEIFVPLEASIGRFKSCLSLCLSLNLVELRNTNEASENIPKFTMSAPVSPNPGKVLLIDRNEGSSLKAGLRKVKFFKALSIRRHKKAYHEEEGCSDGRNSVRSEDPNYVYPVDTDSLDDESEGGESEEGNEDTSVQKSFSYETLVYANHAGGSFCSNTSSSSDNEDLVHYSHHISDTRHKYPEDTTAALRNQSAEQSSKRSILPWRKRKLSFRSPKTKGEPLLKKHYGEDGGDDIDFDRRQLCSSDESSSGWYKSEEASPNRFSISEFGDDSFAVGSWEQKEITSRDGQMKLQTQIFFASIDQRSERAAGESACTALVAVIADWFHCNPEDMPIKSQLDCLIREGSLQWRDLCEKETYMERFPDKHFDLETVLEAKVRPLSVVSEKSFIGFFHPEGIEEEEGFDFLDGAMSFDNIWDEICKSVQETPGHGDSFVYIVSWNDHFFILKVEKDAYYIIDTLGERLFEGCNQAYILKFDKDTTIMQVPSESQQSDDKPSSDRKEKSDVKEAADEGKIVICTNGSDKMQEDMVPEIIYSGKEACKEYIKSFLAAIPIRELQVDVKKGLMASTPLHQRLQIEFHYTTSFDPKFESSSTQVLTANSLAILPSASESQGLSRESDVDACIRVGNTLHICLSVTSLWVGLQNQPSMFTSRYAKFEEGKMDIQDIECPLISKSRNEESKNKRKCDDFLEEVKKILALAGPLMSVNFLLYCLQVISVMFVGHLGELALSGASMATSFATVTGFSLLMGMGSALDTICGQAYGAKQYHMLGIHMQRAMIVLLLVSIPLAFIWANAGHILEILGQSPEIAAEAGDYARFMIPSIFAYSLLQCQMRFLQAQNDVLPMMLTAGATTLLHLFTCWFLVLKTGLGNKGAALANAASYWINVFLLAAYIGISPSCKSTWTGFSIVAFSDIPRYLRLAIPSAVMVCLESWSFEMMVLLSGLLPNPKLETSVLSISLNTSSMIYMLPFGLSGATSIRVSNELGAGRPKAARIAAYTALFLATTEGILVAMFIISIRKFWGHCYSNEEEVVTYVSEMLMFIAGSHFIDANQSVLSGIARGCGWQKIGAIVNLGAYYLWGIPAGIVLGFFYHVGGKGLWLGLTLSLLAQALIYLVVTLQTNWDKEAKKAADRVIPELA
ncbi:hypothetical protein KY290_023246 [Solanum tuberosum]|uniref:Protein DETOXIFICATION n=1 Tax=Solanum tuberosum TaxID=4113 RepID=A0ABQ7V6P0_SOLTU|nr:hypothetical protein KY290_023246 [Solanum tuberosum]